MSKNQNQEIEFVEAKEVAIEFAGAAEPEIIKTGISTEALSKFSKLAAQLGELDVCDINESAKILSFERSGESYRLLLVDIEDCTKVDETTGAIDSWKRFVFVDENATLRYASNGGIKRALQNANIPSAWNITYTGPEEFKSPDGTTSFRKAFDIRRLLNRQD
jgi:hypothetical protein